MADAEMASTPRQLLDVPRIAEDEPPTPASDPVETLAQEIGRVHPILATRNYSAHRRILASALHEHCVRDALGSTCEDLTPEVLGELVSQYAQHLADDPRQPVQLAVPSECGRLPTRAGVAEEARCRLQEMFR